MWKITQDSCPCTPGTNLISTKNVCRNEDYYEQKNRKHKQSCTFTESAFTYHYNVSLLPCTYALCVCYICRSCISTSCTFFLRVISKLWLQLFTRSKYDCFNACLCHSYICHSTKWMDMFWFLAPMSCTCKLDYSFPLLHASWPVWQRAKIWRLP